MISPQFHVIFDDEFTTVPYLQSDTSPPNWHSLISTSSETATEDQKNLAYDWLHPDKINPLSPDVSPPPLVSEGATSDLPTGQHDSIGDTIGTTSEGDTILSNSQSMRGSGLDTGDTSFVNLDTLGLRRSARVSKNPRRTPYGLLVMTLSTFCSGIKEAAIINHQCFQAQAVQYNDYLECCFDGTPNSLSPLAHIYQTSIANNEVFNLSEMLKLPDKMEFVKAMHDEVASMFKAKI